jgi:hypothetical protein
VDAALLVFVLRRAGAGRSFRRVRGARESVEPGANARERTHKAAGTKKTTTEVAASCEETVELLLVYLIHVQQAVGGALGEGGIFDIFTKHARALLFAASEEVSAGVAVRLRLDFLILLVTEIV